MVLGPGALVSVIKQFSDFTIEGNDSLRAELERKFAELFTLYEGQRVPLAVLENFLEGFKNDSGISKTKLKKTLREMGVCVANCQVLGSSGALAIFLRHNRHLNTKIGQAKKYGFVKLCLIKVGRRAKA